MSSPSASELRDALNAFMAASATREAGQIGPALKRVLELEKQLPADAPERLRHFLTRRSYQKALDFLKSGRPESETPQCGG